MDGCSKLISFLGMFVLPNWIVLFFFTLDLAGEEPTLCHVFSLSLSICMNKGLVSAMMTGLAQLSASIVILLSIYCILELVLNVVFY